MVSLSEQKNTLNKNTCLPTTSLTFILKYTFFLQHIWSSCKRLVISVLVLEQLLHIM